MAKQKSIFKVQGTIGDATFYKTGDGHLVREKGGVTAERIKNDPAFQRTRENNAEFAYAGKAGQLLRNAFSAVVKQASDNKVVSRLLKQIRETMRTDLTSVRGERNLSHADLGLLESFDFNVVAKMETVFSGVYKATLNRTTGLVSIEVDSFVPERQLTCPVGATHCRLVAAAAAVDFVTGTRETATAEGSSIPLDNSYTADAVFNLTLTPDTTLPVFMVLGIEFYQEVNNVLYLLRNGGFNAIKIISVKAV